MNCGIFIRLCLIVHLGLGSSSLGGLPTGYAWEGALEPAVHTGSSGLTESDMSFEALSWRFTSEVGVPDIRLGGGTR